MMEQKTRERIYVIRQSALESRLAKCIYGLVVIFACVVGYALCAMYPLGV